MGLVKGTIVGIAAVGGALASQFMPVTGMLYVDWVAGAFIGTVAGDIVTKLFGRPVALGKGPGIIKGLLAAGGGAAGLYFGTGLTQWILITWGSAVLGDLLL